MGIIKHGTGEVLPEPGDAQQATDEDREKVLTEGEDDRPSSE